MKSYFFFLFLVPAFSSNLRADDSVSLLRNPGFQTLDGNGHPIHWRMPEGWRREAYGEEWNVETQGGERFLRLSKTSPRDSLLVEQRLEVRSEWGELRLEVEMRMARFQQGSAEWNNAVVWIGFTNSEGKPIGTYPNAALALKRNTPEWTTLARTVAVPADAAEMSVKIGLAQCTGILDVDDVRIVPGELP